MADIVEIIIKATDQSSDAFKQLQDNMDKSNKKGLDLTGTFKGLGIAALAMGAVFTGAIVAGFKLSLDAAMQFADSLELVNRLVGISGDEAAAFAASMQFVGMSVEEGVAGLSIFARNAQNAKDSMKTASAGFRESMNDLVSANKDAVGSIRDTWKTAQSDAADQSAKVWQDFFERAQQAQADLAKSIQRSTEDAERNKARSIEDLNLSTGERMRRARTAMERNAIRDDDREQRAKIDRDFKRKQEDIAQEKQRREQDLAEKEAADRQAAERQTAIIAANLKKQEEQYNIHLAKQEESFAKSAKKLQEILAKANVSSPFQKAMDTLHLKLSQVMDDTGKINFAPILEALNKMPEGAAKMQIMMELFGRGGVKFAEWVETAAKSTKELDAILKLFGVDTSPKAVEAANTLSRAWNLVGIETNALFTKIGQQLIPILTPLVNKINTEILPALNEWSQTNMPKLITALEMFINFIRVNIMPTFQTLADDIKTGNFSKIPQDIGDIFGKIWSYVLPELIKFKDEFILWAQTPEVQAAFKEIGRAIGGAVMDGLSAALKETGVSKGNALDEAIYRLMGMSEGEIAWRMSGAGTGGTWKGQKPGEGFQTGFGESRMIPGGFNQPVPIIAHGGEIIGRPSNGKKENGGNLDVTLPSLKTIFDGIGKNVAQELQKGFRNIKLVNDFKATINTALTGSSVGNQLAPAVVGGSEIIGRPGNSNGASPDMVIVGFDRNAYQTFMQPFIEKGILIARSKQIGATR